MSTFSRTYAGRINLVQATWQSDNTVFAQLALDLGPKRIVAVAHKMGIESRLAAYPSIVLGADVVDPLEVADAYATLADEGVRHAPTAIASIAFPDGRVWRARRGRRVVPAGVAYVVDQILVGNCRYGTAAAMPSYYTGTAAGRLAPPRTTSTPGSAVSTRGSRASSGWAIRRPRSRCPACRAPPTACRSGAPTTGSSSDGRRSPASHVRR